MPERITWSAPVRYAEVDQQGVVFNAHYLLYCDEAMGAFCAERDLLGFAARVRLVSSSLVWSGPARWGDVIEIVVGCRRVGRTSVTIGFDVRASGRPCCAVETTYVHADEAGAPVEIEEKARTALAAVPA